MSSVDEEHASLWALAVPPLIWATHFLLSYWTAAVWCAKFADAGGSLALARLAIAVYSALALAALALTGYQGYRRHHLEQRAAPHDEDSPESRYRFMGYAAMLLSGLSAIAIVYATLVVLYIRSCV
ncbi:MAG TPA: hypothetical protein VFX59_18845 [Polyangiales bacterium]|nr:hypothetical protein [Polyangiales bacterium]